MKIFSVAAVMAISVLAASGASAGGAPVVLELFTSEGCSSCPPADLLLASLDRQPVAGVDLIVVSEHVDYWNYLGWKDPYSSPVFSARQKKYADRLGTDVYTPQMVVDGHAQVLGSDRKVVMQAIAGAGKERKVTLTIRATRTATGAIHVEETGGAANADLYVIVAADRAQSQVLRGENGGHVLAHVAVAQSVTKAGRWTGTGGHDVRGQGAQTGGTRVIAFLAQRETGKILGAAQTRF